MTVTKPDGTTSLAKLVMNQPAQVGLKTDNSTQYHAYTRNGDTMYIGLGKSGVKVGGTYIARANRGLVVFDGTACNYHKEKMSFGKAEKTYEAPKPVKCEVQTAGDKSVFHYQTPKFMKEGQFEDNQVKVMGDALVNDQLLGHAVIKGPAPKVGEAAKPAEAPKAP